MSLLEKVLAASEPLRGIKNIVICTHAKHSTVELCRVIHSLGIGITFFPVAYSREQEHIDTLHSLGVHVAEDANDPVPFIENADCAIEDGARISKLIRKYNIATRKQFFTVEQTSGGYRYFTEHPPAYPVINVAMSPLKLEIENKKATPEGVIHYFAEATGKMLGGKRVLVIGFGSIGEGLAHLARIQGAYVTVYDSLATKRVFAKHRGYETVEKRTFDHVLPQQDIIFMATNTYQGSALSSEQLLLMKDNAIICNAGSGRGELDIELQNPGTFMFHDTKTEIKEDGAHLRILLTKAGVQKQILVLGKAFPINLHLGKGTSHDVIEVVMAMLLLAALHGPKKGEAGIQPLDLEIQEQIAQAMLDLESKSDFGPRYVKSRTLDVIDRPYGGVFAFHDELNIDANVAVIRAWFKAGSKTRGHYHRRTQEAYYVEKGNAELVLWHRDNLAGKTTYSMCEGDYLLIPENYFHDILVTSTDDFECLVIATPPFEAWDQFFISSNDTVVN
jgi:adenosylhomocysteinase